MSLPNTRFAVSKMDMSITGLWMQYRKSRYHITLGDDIIMLATTLKNSLMTNSKLNFKRFFFMIILGIVMISCNKRFDKTEWISGDGIENYPHRINMINDLLTNYKLKGLTYNQLIDLIGKPQSNIQNDSNWIYYPIKINYKNDIDPIYTKYLVFKLSMDSVVIDYKINEWIK
jgi:hypothetical protein